MHKENHSASQQALLIGLEALVTGRMIRTMVFKATRWHNIETDDLETNVLKRMARFWDSPTGASVYVMARSSFGVLDETEKWYPYFALVRIGESVYASFRFIDPGPGPIPGHWAMEYGNYTLPEGTEPVMELMKRIIFR